MKKLKEKISKLALISFVCFSNASLSLSYDEITEIKYKTFDNKTFTIKENAILHEKVQKNVNLLLEEFKKEIKELEILVHGDVATTVNIHRYHSGELREKKDLYEKYDDCLYKCLKSLEEKGIKVEIKLAQIHGTLTTYRSSNSE